MRTMKRMAAVLAVAALAPMAGLGSLAPAARAQDNVELQLWMDTTGGSETAECIVANAIEPFNALGNGTTINATMQANAWDATRTAIAGGAGPDIVGTPGPSFAMQLALAGQLADLDAYAAEFGWDEQFAANSLNLGKVDGKLYSIPAEIETLVLYYNKNLFEENGWEVPATLDEMMALAQQIDEAGIIPFAHTNAEWRPANEWFVGELLTHNAGPEKVYQALVGELPWTDADFVAANPNTTAAFLCGRRRPAQLRRGSRQRERLGLGAGAVDGRRGDLHPRHRPDLLGQCQLGEPRSGGRLPRLLLLAGDPGPAALRMQPRPGPG